MSAPLAILAIGDTPLRERMRSTLLGLRWHVLEACGGADALAQLKSDTSSTVIMDGWFPDLEIQDFLSEVESTFPKVDLISTDGTIERSTKPRNSRHGELLYALRLSQQLGQPQAPSSLTIDHRKRNFIHATKIESCAFPSGIRQGNNDYNASWIKTSQGPIQGAAMPKSSEDHIAKDGMHSDGEIALPEFIGSHPVILEMCRRIRLVAPRDTNVLIQGPSGSGKELVARALHRLSLRKDRSFVALNCAAIPESLLESELFGHAKGSFTGAVQARTGRIEAASGGTLFLDEIGEMPLPLQAKLLRFLESGEIQKLGHNDTHHVDTRVIAASNQQLGILSSTGGFRRDLFYRLAVFLIETPALLSHMEDVPILADFFLARFLPQPRSTTLSVSALEKLRQHRWPGNVRELSHVIERSFILSENRSEITSDEIEFASSGSS